jgi:hypothetical protein
MATPIAAANMLLQITASSCKRQVHRPGKNVSHAKICRGTSWVLPAANKARERSFLIRLHSNVFYIMGCNAFFSKIQCYLFADDTE